jgi:CheY-like chemotaxis protein
VHDLCVCVCVCVCVDAPSNRKLLSMLLNRSGLQLVTLAEDGQAAVDICRQQSSSGGGVMGAGLGQEFGVIFMDNTMPRLVRVICPISLFLYSDVVVVVVVFFFF